MWVSVEHAYYHMTFLASGLLTDLHGPFPEFLCLFIPDCKNEGLSHEIITIGGIPLSHVANELY